MAGVSMFCTPVVRAARQVQLFGRCCILQFTRPVSKGSGDGSSIPPKPKRPLNAYLKFANEKLDSIRTENPALSIKEHMAIAGQKWRRLSDEEKEKYKPTSTDMQRFSHELEAWNSKLTDNDRQEIKLAEKRRRVFLAKFRLKRRQKQLGRPAMPPLSAFSYYVKSMPIERGDAPVTMYIQGLAQQWRKMAEEDKEPFEKQAKDARVLYNEKLHQWENKMIKEGNFDVVRQASLPKDIDKKTRKPKVKKATKKATTVKKATKSKRKSAKKSKAKSTKKKAEEEDHSWMRDE